MHGFPSVQALTFHPNADTLAPLMNRLAAVLVALTGSAASVRAQQAGDTTVLRPVVVSATRVPIGQDAAPASVTVLRGEDLRARGITTVSDALAAVPGLAVVRSGSFGATTAVFARGGESDYMKVLVDGVPLNNPGGAFDFATLSTDNIDRIEVVRGPASVVYGSDAVSGVVQLFTRHGAGAPRGSASIRGGSFGTLEGEAGAGGSSRALGYSLGVASRESDGILPFNNDYRNRVASGRLTFELPVATIDLTARRIDATYHFPTDGSGAVVDSNAARRDHRTVLGLNASKSVTSRVAVRLLGAASRLDGGSANDPDSPGDTAGFYSRDDSRIDRRSVDLRADIRAADQATVSVGAVVEREQARSTGESQFQTFPVSVTTFAAHRTDKSAYAQVIGNALRRATYTASGRVDETATFGTFVTGRASLAWDLGRGSSVRAAVGNAFKAPAFDETFSSSFTIGNPDLRPEQTVSWEVSAEQRVFGRAVVSATYFDQRFRDLIQYVVGDASTGFRGTNENLAAATSHGVELEARAPNVARFDLGANLTLLRTRVTDAGTGAFGTFVNGDRLLRRPARTAAFDAAYHPGHGSTLGAVVRYVGARDDRDFANDVRVELDAYTLVDLTAELSLASVSHGLSPLALTARVENAFDRAYQPVFGFDAPGRAVLVGVRAAIGGTR
jgi:vitamin B12 transporter